MLSSASEECTVLTHIGAIRETYPELSAKLDRKLMRSQGAELQCCLANLPDGDQVDDLPPADTNSRDLHHKWANQAACPDDLLTYFFKINGCAGTLPSVFNGGRSMTTIRFMTFKN